MSLVSILPSNLVITALALPYLSEMDAKKVPRNRFFPHPPIVRRPTTTNLQLLSTGLPSVSFLNMRIDARLIALDPEVTR